MGGHGAFKPAAGFFWLEKKARLRL